MVRQLQEGDWVRVLPVHTTRANAKSLIGCMGQVSRIGKLMSGENGIVLTVWIPRKNGVCSFWQDELLFCHKGAVCKN